MPYLFEPFLHPQTTDALQWQALHNAQWLCTCMILARLSNDCGSCVGVPAALLSSKGQAWRLCSACLSLTLQHWLSLQTSGIICTCRVHCCLTPDRSSPNTLSPRIRDSGISDSCSRSPAVHPHNIAIRRENDCDPSYRHSYQVHCQALPFSIS